MIKIDPVKAPVLVGLKVTVRVQKAPGAREKLVDEQAPVPFGSAKGGLGGVILETTSGVVVLVL